MASYQSRQRDPLLDSTTQAAIEKRGRELIGIGLFLAGLMVAMMLWSYVPDDPNFMSATDAPVQNLLGRPGASIAAVLFMIVGYASWMVPLVLAAWGLRFVFHSGQERAVGRIVFAPIAIAVSSVYCATLVPGTGWDETFGLGGHFGDQMLSILLTILPFGTLFSTKLMSFIMGLGVVALLAFALGFTMQEIKKLKRFLLIGMIVAYSALLRVLGQTASASYKGAQAFGNKVQERRELSRQEKAAQEAELAAARAIPAPTHEEETARVAAIVRSNPAMPTRFEDFDPVEPTSAAAIAARNASPEAELVAPTRAPEPESKPGLFASFLKRADPMPAPELVENPVVEPEVPTEDGDRVSKRIANAIRSRNGQPQEVQVATKPGVNPAITAAIASRLVPQSARAEPPVAKTAGPRPLVLNAQQQEAVAAADAPVIEAPMVDVIDDDPDFGNG